MWVKGTDNIQNKNKPYKIQGRESTCSLTIASLCCDRDDKKVSGHCEHLSDALRQHPARNSVENNSSVVGLLRNRCLLLLTTSNHHSATPSSQYSPSQVNPSVDASAIAFIDSVERRS